MKKIITLLLQITLIIALAACSTATAETTASDSAAQLSAESEAVNVATDTSAVVASSSLSVKYDSEDLNPNTNAADVSYIKLEGDTISFEGDGAGVDGNVLTITSAGVYDISGMLTELTYSIGMKKSNQIQNFLTEIKNLNGNNKVTLIAGYNSTDL